MRRRRSRLEIVAEAPPVSQWPMPDVASVPEHSRQQYLRQERAVHMWLGGNDENEIHRATGLAARQTRRMVERCIAQNPLTGRNYGFWACLPGFRLAGLARERVRAFNPEKAGRGLGLAGALGDLFRRYPKIKAGLVAFVQTRKVSGSVRASGVQPRKLHAVFLALCKQENVPQTDWPFIVKQRGYKAINYWYGRQRFDKPAASANNEGGTDEAGLVRSNYQRIEWNRGKGQRLAFERTEMDEHYCDGVFEIGFPMSSEHIETILTKRLWALVMVETRSNAALASCMAYGDRYNRNDVLKVIRRALLPPARYQLTLKDPEYRYAEGAAYPAELPEFERNTWQTLAFDADKSHLSGLTLQALESAIGCHVLNERVGDARARPDIEGFFKNVAEAMSWLPSATGNRPDSPVRRNPEKEAVRHHIVAHLAEELLDVTCRNYNVTPNSGCGGLTPLFMLKELLQRGEVYRLGAGELTDERLWMLLPSYPAKLNRVSRKTRLGPLYVELYGGRYSSPELANAQELALQDNWNVRLYVEEDARFGYLVPEANPTRAFKVVITGKHAETPHTLEWRRAYDVFSRTQRMAARGTNPISMVGFARGLAAVGKDDNKAAALLGDVMSFMTRYSRGEVPLVGFEKDEDQRLLDAVHQIDIGTEDDQEEGGADRPIPLERDGSSSGIVFGP